MARILSMSRLSDVIKTIAGTGCNVGRRKYGGRCAVVG